MCVFVSTTVLAQNISSAPTKIVAVRISGLVCDLCVENIEKGLKNLPNVQDALADPRPGLIAMTITGSGPSEQSVRKFLLNEGYSVHAFAYSTKLSLSAIRSDPEKSTKFLWAGGDSEQKILLENTPANLSTCALKGITFGTVDKNVWGSKNTLHSNSSSINNNSN